jgi:predicted  nucleic acid-binding Zn-ribbon protein
MKFLKHFRLFLEADEVDVNIEETPGSDELVNDNEKTNQDALNSIQKDIAYYRSKKEVMGNIFKDVNKQDSQINDELQKNIYKNERDMKKRNRYLKELESVYTLKRKADKISLQIETDMERVDEINKQINDLKDRFNQLDDSVQKSKVSDRIEKSRDYLKKLNQTLLTNKSEYSKIDKNYQKKRDDFESMMRAEEQKIKNLSQK